MQRVETISFKFDTVGAWIEREWVATHPEYEWVTLWAHYYMRHETVLAQVPRQSPSSRPNSRASSRPMVSRAHIATCSSTLRRTNASTRW
jgi:hypothetical protein